MKFVRFARDNRVTYGVMEVVKGQEMVRQIKGNIYGSWKATESWFSPAEVKVLAPCQPSKIIGVGLNYKAHAEEINRPIPTEPFIFLMPPTSVIGPEDAIVQPRSSREIGYEGELGVVIGKRAKAVSEVEAEDYVLGYTCFNDVTARDIQRSGQLDRSKGFDTFAPLGPFIETELKPGGAKVETYLNGELRQSSSTSDLIFSVAQLVAFVSATMTLLPGDVIATGTPSGIGLMKPGDVVEVRIEGLGTLRNKVVAA